MSMKDEFEYLIGKSIVGHEINNENEEHLLVSDGSKLKISSNPYVDCCGYNSFEVNLQNGFDFADNVITKVDYSEELSKYDDDCGNITLGIFSNNKKIVVSGEYGSGSGWNYGQYVEIEVISKEEVKQNDK